MANTMTDAATKVVCPRCGGSGQIEAVYTDADPGYRGVPCGPTCSCRECPRCDGTGRKIR